VKMAIKNAISGEPKAQDVVAKKATEHPFEK
jgi:formaldehyde-activating enzyme involved in methanogenesis